MKDHHDPLASRVLRILVSVIALLSFLASNTSVTCYGQSNDHSRDTLQSALSRIARPLPGLPAAQGHITVRPNTESATFGGNTTTGSPSPKTTVVPQPSVSGLRSSNAASNAVITLNNSLQLRPIRDLNFGTAVIGSQGGTITTNPNGTVTCTGSVILEPSSIPTAGQFQFWIKDDFTTDLWVDNGLGKARRSSQSGMAAQPEQQLSIVTPAEAALTNGNHSYALTVDDFKYTIQRGLITVGATLHIKPIQALAQPTANVQRSFSGSYPLTLVLE